ncbi:hypothetical protein BCV70DRAFT_197835 [Testicularia cyperi]|uniref:U three protein 23 n=1 Tax=Testicularia cyperi TaxID=1882483 RepID=A0A317XZB9_9BASI|nr:hypothetical protein BCV70DRAFT_197835 [Testicularia cyperi]
MMHQYELHFGFRDPYQLLLDETFALALVRYKVQDPARQFCNVLQSKKIKPMISQCCMEALYKQGKEVQSTIDLAKTWERRKCNHREPIPPIDCVKQCIGENNKHRYILASENAQLRKDLRLKTPALPMMHFAQSVMVMEPMSSITLHKIETLEEQKLSLPASEAGLLRSAPKVQVDIVGADPTSTTDADADAHADGTADTQQPKPKKLRGGPSNPNPLSVRKAKQPKLTKEEKLAKEQEIKKAKQRAAAKARLLATSNSHNVDANANANANTSNADADVKADAKLKAEAKVTERTGEKRKRQRQLPDPPAETAPSAPAMSSQPPVTRTRPESQAATTPATTADADGEGDVEGNVDARPAAKKKTRRGPRKSALKSTSNDA